MTKAAFANVLVDEIQRKTGYNIPFIILGMIMLPIYYINQLRWYKHLKWYQFKKVLQSIYLSAGNEGALFNTSAIYAYLTLIVVIAFYLWNSLMS
jgi:hypothetical protein